jgi:hypothetical protein
MHFYFQDKITKEKFYNRNHIFSTNYLTAIENNTLFLKYADIFSKIDWSIEPTESLETLFYQRAQQLRNYHSYLILYFSGGSDSTTILQIYLKNNIPIDELIINRFSDVPDIRHNGTVALEYLKRIEYKGKVTVVDITYDSFKQFFNKQLAFHNGYFPGFLHSLLRMRIDFFQEYNLVKSINRPSSIGHIFGEASPIIHVIDNKYYVQLIGVRNMGSTTYHAGNIHFFTSEKFPQLHVKQSHIIVNYFKEHFPEETTILESTKKYNYIYKKLLRYNWDTRADFSQKSTGMPGLLKGSNEASVITDFYNSKDTSFYQDYYSAYLKEYLNTKLYKKYNNIWPVLTPGLNIPKYFIS